VKKAQAVVVVLDVQTRTKAFGLLVQEAEDTLVLADMQVVEEIVGERHAEMFIEFLLDSNRKRDAIALKRHLGILASERVLPVHDVAERLPVDGENPVADENSGSRRKGVFGNGLDDISRDGPVDVREAFVRRDGKGESHKRSLIVPRAPSGLTQNPAEREEVDAGQRSEGESRPALTNRTADGAGPRDTERFADHRRRGDTQRDATR
jgi:hypothetical protein